MGVWRWQGQCQDLFDFVEECTLLRHGEAQSVLTCLLAALRPQKCADNPSLPLRERDPLPITQPFVPRWWV